MQECIRKRFQVFAPEVHINGRHYLNVTTQNAQQIEQVPVSEGTITGKHPTTSTSLRLISSGLVSATNRCWCKTNDPLEHSLALLQGGGTDGREESCCCYSLLHARHAVRVRPAAGGRIHTVLWLLQQLLPWLQGGQPSLAVFQKKKPAWLCTIKCVESCAVNLHKVPVAAFGAGDCSKICLSSICSVAERGDGKRRLLLHSNLALINFVFAYKFFIFLCPCIWICQGQLMPVLQQLALMIAP